MKGITRARQPPKGGEGCLQLNTSAAERRNLRSPTRQRWETDSP